MKFLLVILSNFQFFFHILIFFIIDQQELNSVILLKNDFCLVHELIIVMINLNNPEFFKDLNSFDEFVSSVDR